MTILISRPPFHNVRTLSTSVHASLLHLADKVLLKSVSTLVVVGTGVIVQSTVVEDPVNICYKHILCEVIALERC